MIVMHKNASLATGANKLLLVLLHLDGAVTHPWP